MVWGTGMPTNILRQRSVLTKPHDAGRLTGPRDVVIETGQIKLRARLADTLTAMRIWSALPLFSTVEVWGACIHFEVPVHTGRERTARLNVSPGDICFWSEDDRIIIGFGPTPISKPNEIRLMRPCNIWATTNDDVTALRAVQGGDKITMAAVRS